jgi:hypothetical protein
MNETVISWNLPNVVSVILMVLIIWIVFGFIGHFVFRQGGGSSTGSQTINAATPSLDMVGM